MAWESVPFSQLYAADSRNGLTKPSKVRGSGFKMINMGELFANDRIYDIPMELVPLTESEKKNCQVLQGDLLFARQSLVLEGAGKCSVVMDVSPMTVFESHLIRVRLNQKIANPLFYYYFFRSPLSPVKTIVSQCAQAGIRGSDLQDLAVVFPPLDVQTRIADILSAYDSLIETNQRQIKLLEEAAQRLYREWFVDLRFPGHEDVPLVDGVPEGWSIQTIADIASVNCDAVGKDWPYATIDYIDISSVTQGQIGSKTTYEVKDAPGRARRIAHDGDIIWSMVRPNLRAYALVQYPDKKDVFSTGFAVLSARKVPFPFLYCSVTTDDFVGYLVNCTNGAAYPAVKPIHFEQAKITVPSMDVLQKFERLTLPMFREIHYLSSKNNRLSEARDRLLPKLMSGEIAV